MTDARDPSVGGISVSESADRTTAHLWGEIDDSVRQQAGATLTRALERGLPVVLDASRVEFIDSAGVAFLIQLCTVAREEGVTVSLHEPPRVVSEVIDLLGLHDLFDDVPPDAPGARDAGPHDQADRSGA
ncbi:STAS domain-containing protein [Cellulomonas carbonis]|uniref:Anti-anti-sigma factor n=1 Tax=Cellulomonas carbonis T26 TaxID=947969 RepID=A0A0A0BSG1_9CELL|nr:STAS domain-containing protein [Cellulomonas carbonis]KGM10850.1 anti-anti-sigma factor [Cellulomonas carbonis T26]GGB92409.1 hypothetical protein GCM10010972_01370 [Cellulomonas carbonis]